MATRPRKDALLAFASQGVSSATNFLRMLFIVRLCTATQVDLYALGMTIVLLAVALHERLVESPYTFYANRAGASGGRSLLGNTVLFSVAALSLASAGVLVVGLAVLATGGDPEVALMLVVVALAMPPIVFRELARSAAFTQFRMPTAVAVDTATLVVQATLLAGLWWTDRLTVAWLYAAIALSSAAASAGWLVAWRRDWSIDRRALAEDWRRLWSFSRWLVLARLMGNASRLVIPWIVFAILGDGEAGLMATCASLVGLAWLFVRGVNNFYRPYVMREFAKRGPAAARRAVLACAAMFTAFIAPVCVLLAARGDWLLVTLYGDKLAGAGAVVFVLAVNTLLTSWSIAGVNGLMAIDRTGDTPWCEGLTLVVTLAAVVPMTFGWGLVGAAAAMTLGNVAGAACSAVLFERGIRLTPAGAPAHA